MVIVDEGRRNLAKCLRGTNARQVIVDELADMQTTVLDLTETTRTAHGEDETLLGWWVRLHFIATGDDDFPDMRSLFMRLAGLIDRAEVDDD